MTLHFKPNQPSRLRKLVDDLRRAAQERKAVAAATRAARRRQAERDRRTADLLSSSIRIMTGNAGRPRGR